LPEYAVRQATHDDTKALSTLLLEAARVAWYSDVRDAERLIERQRVFLVEDAGRPAGVCGITIGPQSVARIQVFASRERGRAGDVLRAALKTLRSVLSEQGVEALAFIGPDEWLLSELAAQGFERVNTILTLHKHSLRVPDRGNLEAIVRPVQPTDLPGLVAIDEAAFAPLWRNTEEIFREYTEQCTEFCVAELEGTVVGYDCLNVIGRHGHITRIAVHPRYQGRRIGVRLLAEAIAVLAQDGVLGITLNTQQDNERALRLYTWFGFRSLGREAEVLVLRLLPPTLNSGIMEL
jgi:ribosomal-protein-alanine N-acetyltransferase